MKANNTGKNGPVRSISVKTPPPIGKPIKETHNRIVSKNGDLNLYQPSPKREKYLILQYSKLIGSSWIFTMTVFMLTLVFSWFLFAVLYWLICFAHGDFDHQKEDGFVPCIHDIHNFASCYQFSVETQHTVGYGIKAPTDECPEAIFVNIVQCVVGFVMQGFMAVIIFSKMTLPRLRSKTILFSKNIVVCVRNNKLCVMFRVGDVRKNHLIEASVRAFFVQSTRTPEGERLTNIQKELALHVDGVKETLFFNWPMTVFHEIDSNSPLYYMSPSDLCQDSFEILVVLEGVVESTGQMTQARTSYMPGEILWGRKFESMLSFDSYRKELAVNFSKFDALLPASTPLCSAAYVEEYGGMQKNYKVGTRSHLRLDFTPRHSVGEVNKKTLAKLKDIVQIKIYPSSGNEETE